MMLTHIERLQGVGRVVLLREPAAPGHAQPRVGIGGILLVQQHRLARHLVAVLGLVVRRVAIHGDDRVDEALQLRGQRLGDVAPALSGLQGVQWGKRQGARSLGEATAPSGCTTPIHADPRTAFSSAVGASAL